MATETPIGIGLIRPDLLGTYGDSGNAEVLAQRLRWRNMPSEVIPLGPGDTIPTSVRVVVIGGGEDRAQLALLDDTTLLANVTRCVERGAAVLGVCAGLQVLGRHFTGADGMTHTGLGLLDCVSHRLDRRAVGECITHQDLGPLSGDEATITGFENHFGRTTVGPGSTPLARVTVGVGNGDGTEGAVSGRIIGTYLHGPILARNPALADLLLESTLGELPELLLPSIDQLRLERTTAALRQRNPKPRRSAQTRQGRRG